METFQSSGVIMEHTMMLRVHANQHVKMAAVIARWIMIFVQLATLVTHGILITPACLLLLDYKLQVLRFWSLH